MYDTTSVFKYKLLHCYINYLQIRCPWGCEPYPSLSGNNQTNPRTFPLQISLSYHRSLPRITTLKNRVSQLTLAGYLCSNMYVNSENNTDWTFGVFNLIRQKLNTAVLILSFCPGTAANRNKKISLEVKFQIQQMVSVFICVSSLAFSEEKCRS